MDERTLSDYAIEHAEYLAKAAVDFMDAVNVLDIACDDVLLSDVIEDARQCRTEVWKQLQSAIHEFRKRANKISVEEIETNGP